MNEERAREIRELLERKMREREGTRTRRRRSGGWGPLVPALGAAVMSAFAYGWLVMLGFGAVHGTWPVVPAVGYWTSVGLVVGASTAVCVLRAEPLGKVGP